MLATVNSGKAELLDIPEVLRQLRSLDRRHGSSGRDRVDHRAGEHDDAANAVAGVLSLLGPEYERVRKPPAPEPQTTAAIQRKEFLKWVEVVKRKGQKPGGSDGTGIAPGF